MKAYRFIFAAALILAPLFAQAQPAAGEGQRLTPQVMARMFPAGVVSPEYNADGSVTFRFQAPDAKEVKLDCQMLSQAVPMYKDANGVDAKIGDKVTVSGKKATYSGQAQITTPTVRVNWRSAWEYSTCPPYCSVRFSTVIIFHSPKKISRTFYHNLRQYDRMNLLS